MLRITNLGFTGGVTDMAAGVLTPANLRVALYEDVTSGPGVNPSVDQFIEPGEGGFGGYARQTPDAWSDPYRYQDGRIGMSVLPPLIWIPTDDSGSSTIKGYFIINVEDEDNPFVVAWEELTPDGVTLSTPSDRLQVNINLGFDPNQNAGNGNYDA